MPRPIMRTEQRRGTFWEAFTSHPPCYLRLLAKKDSRTVMSDTEISIASGIDLTRVREINRMTSWHDVTFGEMLALTVAYNFDPTNYRDRHRAWKYQEYCTKRNAVPYRYLRTHPKWESELLPIVNLMRSNTKFLPKSAAA